MKDSLKDFINQHRDQFDAAEPPADFWARVENKLPGATPGNVTPSRERPTTLYKDVASPASVVEPVVKPLNGHTYSKTLRSNPFRQAWMGWAVAATVTLVAGLGWLNYRYGLAEQPAVVAASPAYAKEFTQYTRLIDDKRAELRDLTEHNPALYQQFATELDQLERNYQTLKADLPANPNQEMLIQAMIQNLQLQIDLLNQQLDVIQRIKQQNKPANEPLI